MIKVSIITVCFNAEKTITRTIESVIGQNYKNIEYIIVDGASTDNTIDIIRHYAEEYPDIIKWVSEPDNGIYDAMNKGIAMSTGDLVGIINSDDWYEKDAVSHMVNHYGGKAYQILYGMMRTVDRDKYVSVSWRTHESLKKGMIAHPACFVTRKLYSEKGMYSTEYKCVSDYEFMLRMFEDKEIEFVPVFEIIANFSTGGTCSTGAAWLELLELQKKWGLIEPKEYRKHIIKDKIYKLYRAIIPKRK